MQPATAPYGIRSTKSSMPMDLECVANRSRTSSTGRGFALNEFRELRFTQNYIPRFKWAVHEQPDGTQIVDDVVQPSLHAYPKAGVPLLQSFLKNMLGSTGKEHIEWIPSKLAHVNVARMIPKSAADEQAMISSETEAERMERVKEAFKDIDGPIKLKISGFTANGIQLMATVDNESWRKWQEVMHKAEHALGLTSFPLNLPPDDGGALVSITLGVFRRNGVDDPGADTEALAQKLEPLLPGTFDPADFPGLGGPLELEIDAISYVLHRHSATYPIMRPEQELAMAMLGGVPERQAEFDLVA
jgi:hypothetical protein